MTDYDALCARLRKGEMYLAGDKHTQALAREAADAIAELEQHLRMTRAALAYAHSDERKECLRLMADFIRTETLAERARVLAAKA